MTEQLTRLGVGIDPSEAQRGAQAIIRELDAIRNRARTTVDAVDASFSKLRGTFFHLHTTLLNLKNDLNSKRFGNLGAMTAGAAGGSARASGIDNVLQGTIQQFRQSIDQLDAGFSQLNVTVLALQKSMATHGVAGGSSTTGVIVPGGGQGGGKSNVDRELETMGSRATRVIGQVDAAFARLSATFFNMQTMMATFVGGMIGRQFSQIVGGVQSAMSGVEAVTKASKREMADMTAVARELGAQTVFSARDAAEGMKYLGMSGFTTNEILKATPAMMYLAAAATMDMGQAANITANIMTAFGISAEHAGEIADTLAVVAASANTDISQMGQAMKFAGPLAKGLGVSMQTAAAAIGVLSNAGLQAEMAGTGLRQVMTTLAVPPRELKKAMDAAGLSMKDVDIRSHSLGEILETLKAAGIDAGEAMDIFGARGGTAASVLIDSTEQLKRMEAKLQDVEGAALTMSRIMTDNLPGAFSELESAAEEFVLQLGDSGMSGGIREVIERITGMINVWNGLADPLDSRIESFQNTAHAVEGLATALGTLGVAIAALKGYAFITALGPVGITITGIAAAVGALVAYRDDLWNWFHPIEAANKAWEEQRKITEAQAAALNQLIPSYEKLASKTERTVAEQEQFNAIVERIKNAVPEATRVLDDYTQGIISIGEATDELRGLQNERKFAPQFDVWRKEYSNLVQLQSRLKTELEDSEAELSRLEKIGLSSKNRAWAALSGNAGDLELDPKNHMARLRDNIKNIKQEMEDIAPYLDEARVSFQKFFFASEAGFSPEDAGKKLREMITGFFDRPEQPKLELPVEPEDPSIRKKALKEFEDYSKRLVDLEFELQGERTLIGLEGVEARVQQENLERQRRLRELEQSAREIINVQGLSNEERLALQEEYLRMEEGIIRNSDMRIAAIREDAFKKELEELEQKSKEKLEKAKREQEQLERLAEQYTFRFDPGSKYAAQQTEINDLFEQGLISADVKQRAVAAAQEELRRNNNDLLMSTREWQAGVTVAMDEYAFSAMDAAENFHRAWTNAIQQTENELVDFFMTGKIGFADLMQSITADLVRVAVRQNITGPLAQMIQGNAASMNPFADLTGVGASIGNLFGGGRAKGGPIEAGKMYLTGENGPELIIPGSSGHVLPNTPQLSDLLQRNVNPLFGGGRYTTRPMQGSFGMPFSTMSSIMRLVRGILPEGIIDLLNKIRDKKPAATMSSGTGIMNNNPMFNILNGINKDTDSNPMAKLFGGGRASGGPVTRGMAYLTGEEGPELFVPGQSGQVLSNRLLESLTTDRMIKVDMPQDTRGGNDNRRMNVSRIEINNYYQNGSQVRRDVVTPSRSKRQVMDDLAQMLSSRR